MKTRLVFFFNAWCGCATFSFQVPLGSVSAGTMPWTVLLGFTTSTLTKASQGTQGVAAPGQIDVPRLQVGTWHSMLASTCDVDLRWVLYRPMVSGLSMRAHEIDRKILKMQQVKQNGEEKAKTGKKAKRF